MAEENGEGEFLDFGLSVGDTECFRETAVKETEEISRQNSKLTDEIALEEKLKLQTMKDCKYAANEMTSHLSTTRDAASRIETNEELLNGVYHSLKEEVSSALSSSSARMSIDTNAIPSELPTKEGTTDLIQAAVKMKIFPEKEEARVNTMRLKMDKIKQTTSSQKEEMNCLMVEAGNLEEIIASECLERSLAQTRESTASKQLMLEEIKGRQASLRNQISEVESSSQAAVHEIDVLGNQFTIIQKEKAVELAEQQKMFDAEIQEKSRLEAMLHQVKSHDDEVKKEIQVLKAKDEKLAQFVAQKAEKAKRREDLRKQRNQITTAKRQTEDSIMDAKKRIDKLKRAVDKEEQDAKEIENLRERNDKQEAEVILPAKSELNDVNAEKEQLLALVAENTNRAPPNTFTEESARLTELKNKSYSLRQQLEAKQSCLRKYEVTWAEKDVELTAESSSLRKKEKKTSQLLEDQQSRLENLEANQAKHFELLRKFEILRRGVELLDISRKEERELQMHHKDLV